MNMKEGRQAIEYYFSFLISRIGSFSHCFSLFTDESLDSDGGCEPTARTITFNAECNVSSRGWRGSANDIGSASTNVELVRAPSCPG